MGAIKKSVRGVPIKNILVENKRTKNLGKVKRTLKHKDAR